ncbi:MULTISPECIES: hypothetical protein [unclassified Sphingobium]|uniref:hypothetical protein n=1 Tax=unclassified Sphingobium TaxID=2611147 RepID=UPI0035A703BB
MAHEVIRRLTLGGLCVVALSVAGCGQDKSAERFSMTDQAWSNAFGNGSGDLPPLPEAQPMLADAGGSGAPAYAPPADRLPAARPIAYAQAQGDDYAWIDRADQFSDMLGDAPPDYGFAYDGGVTPWAWESGDDYLRYAEPIDGGYRYYYYEPGAASPYLVRDPWNSYGYRDDRLVAVYDGGGRVLPWREARARDAYASRYYARAIDMRRAARARERERIEARQWAARRSAIAQDRARWAQARREQAQWRNYRARQDARSRQHWATESRAREQAATRFASWQREDFRTPPPRFYDAQQRREAARDRREEQQRRAAWNDGRQAQAERERIADRRAAEQRRAEQERRAVEARQDRRQAQAQRAQAQARQQRAERAARADRARADRAQAERRADALRQQAAQRRQDQAQQAQRRAREAAEADRARQQRAAQAQQRAQREKARTAEAQQRRAQQQAQAQQRAQRQAQRHEQAQQRVAARAERLAQRPDGPGRPHRND